MYPLKLHPFFLEKGGNTDVSGGGFRQVSTGLMDALERNMVVPVFSDMVLAWCM